MINRGMAITMAAAPACVPGRPKSRFAAPGSILRALRYTSAETRMPAAAAAARMLALPPSPPSSDAARQAMQAAPYDEGIRLGWQCRGSHRGGAKFAIGQVPKGLLSAAALWLWLRCHVSP